MPLKRNTSRSDRCQSKRNDPLWAFPPLCRLSNEGESRKRLLLMLEPDPNQPSLPYAPPTCADWVSESNPPPPSSTWPKVRPPPSNPDRVVMLATPETLAPYSGGILPVYRSRLCTTLGSMEVANCPENWSVIGIPSIT